MNPLKLKIAVTGASGLIGSALCGHLGRDGHEILRIVRRPLDTPASPGTLHWQPEGGEIDAAKLSGVGAVVHLAGESIAGYWTAAKKQRIRDSRVLGTRTLCEALAGMVEPPKMLLAASAIGIYGSRGEQPLTERSLPGDGFLAEVGQQWEAATRPAAEKSIRVVNCRLGVVLSREGGALAKMLTPFKLGLGGRLGDGRQFMSWVTLEDAVRAFGFALHNESLRGPVNLTAPHPVTNSEFTQALGRALHRPTWLPAPAFAVRAILGEMGRELLLNGARVFPERLQGAAFGFTHENIDDALAAVLGTGVA